MELETAGAEFKSGEGVPPSLLSPGIATGITVPISKREVSTEILALPELMSREEEEARKLTSILRKRRSALPALVPVEATISLLSYEELKKRKVTIVSSPATDGPKGPPPGSVNDPAMGVIDGNILCPTCGMNGNDCAGHWGMIDLPVPIYNPLLFRCVLMVLTCVCNSCGRLLVDEAYLSAVGLSKYTDYARLNAIYELISQKLKIRCRSNKDVPTTITCDGRTIVIPKEMVGTIRECQPNPKFLMKKSSQNKEVWWESGKGQNKRQGMYEVEQVERILAMIPESDARLLGFIDNHPCRLVMRGVAVTPPRNRPPYEDNGELRPSPITLQYSKIVRLCNDIAEQIRRGEKLDLDKKKKELLKQIQKLIYNRGEGISDEEFLSLFDKMSSKHGMIRNALMGKRGKYSLRTVIEPDPTLRFGEIAIPEKAAEVLTKPVTVNSLNFQECEQLLDKGRVNYIVKARGNTAGRMVTVKQGKKYNLEIGDVIHRKTQKGDTYIPNRQPTLHKYSMMAHQVKIHKEQTMAIHMAITSPYNADFDGDEASAYDIQSQLAEAEAKEIMGVWQCYMNTATNSPSMSTVMDTVTGSYLLTQPDTVIDQDLFFDCMVPLMMEDLDPFRLPGGKEEIPLDWPEFKERTERLHVYPFSGRALFSISLPPGFYYQKGSVSIVDGILISGVITKEHIGNSPNGIVQMLHIQFGMMKVVKFLTYLPFTINRWLTERGFSVGPADCEEMVTEKDKRAVFEKVKQNVKSLSVEGGKLDDPIEEEYRQKQIREHLDTIAAAGKVLAAKNLSKDNSIRIMTKEGAQTKGDLFNVSQMVASIGQQYFKGERPKPVMTEGARCLTSFPEGDDDIEAHGACFNSFWDGLTPSEYYFHQWATREGLMDVSIHTGTIGYLHRRIVKALESIMVDYDGRVSHIGAIFSFIYGGDGFNPAELQKSKGKYKDTYSSPLNLAEAAKQINAEFGYVPVKVNDELTRAREEALKFEEDEFKEIKGSLRFELDSLKLEDQEDEELM